MLMPCGQGSQRRNRLNTNSASCLVAYTNSLEWGRLACRDQPFHGVGAPEGAKTTASRLKKERKNEKNANTASLQTSVSKKHRQTHTHIHRQRTQKGTKQRFPLKNHSCCTATLGEEDRQAGIPRRFLTLKVGVSFSGRTRLNRNDAGSPRSTRSFFRRTAKSEANTHADLSSASPLYLLRQWRWHGIARLRKPFFA